MRCGALRCGAERCGAVRCGAVRCGAVRCGAERMGGGGAGRVRVLLVSYWYLGGESATAVDVSKTDGIRAGV